MALCVMLCMSGCGMVANDAMKVSIDLNAIQAAIDKDKASSGEMSYQEAQSALTRNAATFQGYAAAKTLNFFEFLFNKNKGLLVNGEYAQRLDNANILAAETLLRVNSGNVPDGFPQEAVIKESVVLIDVKMAKDGKRSPSE